MIVRMVLDRLRKWNNPTRQMPYAEQTRILEEITARSVLDDSVPVHRSYAQFLAQKRLNHPGANLLLNLGCLFLLVPLLALVRPSRRGQKEAQALALSRVRRTWLPDSGQEETIILGRDRLRLDLDLLGFLWWSFRARPCLEPYFWAKNIVILAKCCHALSRYRTATFYVSCEYSFTSSMVTGYMERHGIRVINVMHGEKIFNIRDAFVRFHGMYVWDEHYVDLFRQQRASVDEFVVQVPRFLHMDVECGLEVYDLTYYLDYNDEADLRLISACLRGLPGHLKICVRFHPVYGSLDQTRALFPDVHVESPLEVPLDKSFARTRVILSRYSTVLFQGFINGRSVMIDDVTSLDTYRRLQELRFVMMSKKEVPRFSKWIDTLDLVTRPAAGGTPV